MSEKIRIRIANAKKEYIKSIVPIAYTNDFSEAMSWSTDVDLVDYAWVKDNVLKPMESIYLNDGMQTLIMWIFDNDDIDFVMLGIGWDPAGKAVLGTEVWDPVAKTSKDCEDAAKIIVQIVKDEIYDISLRCASTSKTISATMKSLDPSKTTGTASGSIDVDLDKLCDQISQNTKAEIIKPKETLDDYMCNNLLKEELEEIKDFFENSATYRAANVYIPKGILFKGPPGTGKTYAARCIAGSVDCYFMSCTASALQGMYIGSGAENIRAIFKGAKLLAEKSKKWVIIFIDEFDSFGSRENHGGGAGSEEDRTSNQLLAEMTNIDGDDVNVMVMAATNFPERLDNALLRSGRFGRQITIDYPDDYERLNMVKYYFGKISMPLEDSANFDDITALTKGLTPADIKEISNEAGILTIRQGKSEITLDNINEAVNKVITKNIRHPDKSKEELDLVTAHECGHVLAEVLYNNSIPIKVTNYAYGDAGGFTQSADVLSGILPKERFINELKILLGGRAAECVICGYITNGASNDLHKAKSLLYDYYKIYNFEKYEVEKLDQLVLDKLNELYGEVMDDFTIETNNKILKDLIAELYTKRVLYSADIVKLTHSIRKVVF